MNWNFAVSGSTAPATAVKMVTAIASRVTVAVKGVGSSHAAKSTVEEQEAPEGRVVGNDDLDDGHEAEQAEAADEDGHARNAVR